MLNHTPISTCLTLTENVEHRGTLSMKPVFLKLLKELTYAQLRRIQSRSITRYIYIKKKGQPMFSKPTWKTSRNCFLRLSSLSLGRIPTQSKLVFGTIAGRFLHPCATSGPKPKDLRFLCPPLTGSFLPISKLAMLPWEYFSRSLGVRKLK